jgi:TRAP-type mannitol/chloroaromatic compound transport system substrate-binding protein
VANRAAYEKLSPEFKAALFVAARETSAALRQHILVTDSKAIEAFRAKGVEITSLDPKDINAARGKARQAWQAATKNDPIAVKVLESQVAFMKQLGLLS